MAENTGGDQARPEPPTRGACIWLTGRSGAGKTTVTDIVVPALEGRGRVVTVLDTVAPLAKTRGERTSEGKLLRKAFVAGEIVRHGGIVICVTVSARRSVREQARAMVGSDHFVEVHFDVPLEVAQARRRQRGSRRSLRKLAKDVVRPAARLVSARHAVGYEDPLDAEVTIDAVGQSPQDGADAILAELAARGVIDVGSDRSATP